MDINFKRLVSMESVATFMILLIMKLMPHIKLCVPLKHGAITYKNTMIEVICIVNGQYDAHFKRTIIDLSVCIRKKYSYRLHCFPVYVITLGWYYAHIGLPLIR